MKKLLSLLAIGAVLSMLSCGEDVERALNEEQEAAVNDQSQTEAYFNEAGDMSTAAYDAPTQQERSGGRSNGEITVTVEGDTRFNGATVTLVTDPTSTPQVPIGLITIDFGTGQTDPKGVVRSGKILVAYVGVGFQLNSTRTITFDNYKVNGVKIEGTRTIVSTNFTLSTVISASFTVTDVNGKATFEDGTTITRNATHTHVLSYVIGGGADMTTWTVTGQAGGKTRGGVDYAFVINRSMVYRLDCALGGIALPAEGEALFTYGTTVINLNFGAAGAGCDRTVGVSVGGASQEITIG
ncbi:MAG: hypothetical protein AB7K37_12330 [Cyclobacteriaceae bacterium]